MNNPDAEKDVFLDEGWFKTGDLGFIAGGKLIITGREKDLLIYNGVNYYAYEIEYVINKIDEVESNYAAAVSYSEQNNTEGIAVFFTPKDESINNVKEVVRNVKRDLSQQLGLEPHLIIPLRNEDFPRTDSGKIDKPKLRSNLSQKVFGQLYDDLRMSEENSLFDSTVYLTNVDLLDDLLDIKGIDNTNIKLGDQLPKNLSEKDSELYQTYDLSQRKNSERLSLYELEMKDIWSKILQKDSINVNQSFFELGGNSLRAIQIVTRINESLNVDVDIKDLFNHPTVADLSKCLMEKSVSDTILIKPREEADHYELSHSQKMLWILDEQEDEHIAYNMFQAYTFKGNLNIDAFNKAFDLLIERHESLRTVFINVKGEPRQRVLENIDFSLEYTAKSLSQQDINELMAEEISKPFNLSEGPLLRGSLIKTDSDEFVFLFSMHHIISDGWSFEVIIKDIMDLYDSICLDLPLDNQLEIQY
ncbi:MAG: condensation domain-containing protein, partial [Bacteroidota bacterium]